MSKSDGGRTQTEHLETWPPSNPLILTRPNHRMSKSDVLQTQTGLHRIESAQSAPVLWQNERIRWLGLHETAQISPSSSAPH